MKKLISMTDKILQDKLNTDSNGSTLKQLTLWYIRIDGYANFLKLPLDISMFVPCHDDGTPMEGDVDFSQCEPQADNVLFEGFKVAQLDFGNKHVTNGVISIYWYDPITDIWKPSHGLRFVEDLVPYGVELRPGSILDDE